MAATTPRSHLFRRFGLKPTSVDVRTAGKTVTARLRAVDHQAGVRSVLPSSRSRERGGSDACTWFQGPHGTESGKAHSPCAAAKAGRARSASPSSSSTTPGNAGTTVQRGSPTKDGPSRVTVTAADHVGPQAWSRSARSRRPARSRPVQRRRQRDHRRQRAGPPTDRRLRHGPPVPGTWACRNAANSPPTVRRAGCAWHGSGPPICPATRVHRDPEPGVLPRCDRPGGQPVPRRGALRHDRVTGVTASRTQQSDRRPGAKAHPSTRGWLQGDSVAESAFLSIHAAADTHGMDRSEGTLLSHLPEHGRAVHGTAQLSAPATPLGALVAPLVAHRLPIRRMLMPAGIVGDPRAKPGNAPAQVADRDLPPTDADIETDAQGRFRFTVRRLSGMSRFRIAVMAFAVTPPLGRLILTSMLRGSRQSRMA